MKNEKMKCLLIEDNPADVRFVTEVLSKTKGVDIQLREVDRLNKGLELLSVDEFDVILLDLTLPDSSGYDTFTKLHSIVHEIPIIVMSGLDDEEVAVRSVRDGAQDYLVKGTFSSDLLARSLSHSIERNKMEAKLRKSEEIKRVFMNSATEAFFIFNSELKLIDINAIGLEFSGSIENRIVGKHILDIPLCSNDSDRYSQCLEVMNTGESINIEYSAYLPNRDGEELFLALTAFKAGDGLGLIFADVTERKRIEKEKARIDLERVNRELDQKKITLSNVLSQIEGEKRSIRESVALNVEKNVLPIIKTIKHRKIYNEKDLKALEENLKDLTSSFYKNLMILKWSLTPTEIKICKLVKDDYLEKEIAEILNISLTTVKSHKKNIRRKFDITNTPVNLKTFLEEVSI